MSGFRNPIPGIWSAFMRAATLQVWAQIGAGMALTVVFIGYGMVIWKGPWLAIHQAQQINWLGYGMMASAFLVLIALAAITGLSVNIHGGKDGFTGSIDRDEPDPIKVTTTTETTVTQPNATLAAESPPAGDPTQFGGPRG